MHSRKQRECHARPAIPRPKIQIRTYVARHFYFIRPYVPEVTSAGLIRKKKSISIGFCDEISRREAKSRKQQIMATVNAGKFFVQSQIPRGEVCRQYLKRHVPTLGLAARERYPLQIRNHILPTFGDLKLCEITTARIEA